MLRGSAATSFHPAADDETPGADRSNANGKTSEFIAPQHVLLPIGTSASGYSLGATDIRTSRHGLDFPIAGSPDGQHLEGT